MTGLTLEDGRRRLSRRCPGRRQAFLRRRRHPPTKPSSDQALSHLLLRCCSDQALFNASSSSLVLTASKDQVIKNAVIISLKQFYIKDRRISVLTMGWRGITCSFFFLATMAESSIRSINLWSQNLENGPSLLYNWTIASAGIFVLVALVLSMYLLFEHLAAYNQPEEHKFLIGLILMVPVYVLESYLSLVDSNAAFNCEVIRDCYEAFALYCFERYMIACLGEEESTIEFMERKSVVSSDAPLLDEACSYGVVEHPFPLNYLILEWYLGEYFYHSVKIGIVQYVCTYRSSNQAL